MYSQDNLEKNTRLKRSAVSYPTQSRIQKSLASPTHKLDSIVYLTVDEGSESKTIEINVFDAQNRIDSSKEYSIDSETKELFLEGYYVYKYPTNGNNEVYYYSYDTEIEEYLLSNKTISTNNNTIKNDTILRYSPSDNTITSMDVYTYKNGKNFMLFEYVLNEETEELELQYQSTDYYNSLGHLQTTNYQMYYYEDSTANNYYTFEYEYPRKDSIIERLYQKVDGKNILTSWSYFIANTEINLSQVEFIFDYSFIASFGYPVGHYVWYLSNDNNTGFDLYETDYFHYSEINPTATSKTHIAEELSFYPNPTNDEIFLNKDLMNGNYSISNTNGVRIQDGTINYSSLNLNGLSKGTYILQVEKDNNFFIGKVTVQ